MIELVTRIDEVETEPLQILVDAVESGRQPSPTLTQRSLVETREMLDGSDQT